ncbi:MAG TPA: acyltransferase family protein [Microvirga sp.]|jgi:peptidoglycan/LPS O-acetylase OafA/YrhL|nr:acyltransferase family protein [Microvirga sp.]
MSSRLAHRRDIDGLRAIAVLAVILFHWNLAPFGGGFVGVDVFFVISGFLIASTLRSDIERGRFSVLGFYERRLRRIVPALLVLVLAVVAVSPFVFLPADAGRVGDSALASLVFLSNILFMGLAADYFEAGELAVQPLLHTWSLSVEAQFYLFAPAIAWVFLRWGVGRFLGLVAALLVLSFLASAWGTAHWPALTFYALGTRMWELLLGGVLAFRILPAPRRSWQSEALALAGLVLIGLAVFRFSGSTPFPGVAALMPCIGAALLIHAGADSSGWLSGRILGSAPLVFVGRISYLLYLWHWPVLVALRYRQPDGLSVETQVAAALAILLLAVLSWRFVEYPFLRKEPAPLTLRGGATALASLGLAALIGAAFLHLAGRGVVTVAQLPSDVVQLANGQFDRVSGDCEPSQDGLTISPQAPCYLGRTDTPPTVLLWGNSFARMLIPALDEAAHRQGGSAVAAVLSRCQPMEWPDRPWCTAFNDAVAAFLSRNPSIERVVLSANWSNYDRPEGLERTIGRLVEAGKRVYVVLTPPQYDYSIPRALAFARLRGDAPPAPLSHAEHLAAHQPLRLYLEQVAQRHAFTVIDPASILCRTGTCAVAEQDRAFYYDIGHLSVTGARHISSLFDTVFAPPSASKATRASGAATPVH